jgi:hypothetical protein
MIKVKYWVVFVILVSVSQTIAFAVAATVNPVIAYIPPYSFMGETLSYIVIHSFVGFFALLFSLGSVPE